MEQKRIFTLDEDPEFYLGEVILARQYILLKDGSNYLKSAVLVVTKVP
jgi:hypothetical protein